MSEQELRELDGWVLDNLGIENATLADSSAFVVLEKCAEKCTVQILRIPHPDGLFFVTSHALKVESKAETLSLAIALFSKQLFQPGKEK